MQLTRDLTVPAWDERAAQVAAAYLRDRGFANAATADGPVVVGTRGSWWGNFTSFDMTKLRTSVNLASNRAETVSVDLRVNTLGQQITEWNIATWRLELIELHRVLCGLGQIPDVWERFRRDARAASVRWAFSLMIGGQRLAESWASEIETLEEVGTTESDGNRIAP